MTDIPFTCPLCHDTMQQPAARVQDVAVCPNRQCGASFVIERDGSTRLAMAVDIDPLTADEIQTLRKARGRTR